MYSRYFQAIVFVLLISFLLLDACGRSTSNLPEGFGQDTGLTVDDAGQLPLPGEPTLTAGARIAPELREDLPIPRSTAVAGEDFASNRFIAIFESNPSPEALAPYLGTGKVAFDASQRIQADAILPTDNVPLVEHPYFRQVSLNLAQSFGLQLFGRVFYEGVNFAVYEVPEISDVSELDSAMLAVLHENLGLVREVCYDFYLTIPSSTLQDSNDLGQLLKQNPAGFKALDQTDKSANGLKSTSIAAPNDPYYKNHNGQDTADGRGTWGLWRMGAVHNQAWDKTTGSTNVLVCVADTGVRVTHEDLTDNCIDPQNDPPYNAPGILTDVIYKDNNPNDNHGHGTFCAGQIGAKGNNGKGLAGVCWDVTILPVKVLSDTGYGTDSQVAEGMLLADYLGANIISMSLGGPFPDRTTQLAAKQCWQDGILLSVAAGNENTSAPHYPGYYPECICVGATTLVNASDNEDWSLVSDELPLDSRYDARATFSCYGDWVDIAAPGRSVLSTYRTSDTGYKFGWQGTSMATPYVAGCAALLWDYIDNPTNTEIRALLQSSATEMTHFNNAANPDGFESDTSNGLVRFCNVYEAMLLYDDEDYPFSEPTITWDNPSDEDTLSGDVDIRIAVSGGSGTVKKVEFETPTRLLGATDTLDAGYYSIDWDTTFEFNREVPLTAKVYDDKGNTTTDTITVTPDNTHEVAPYTEDFAGLSDNDVPTDWFEFDGNTTASGNTSWGAENTVPGTNPPTAPVMHSSGTTSNYASYSNDWLFAPIIDLSTQADADAKFQRRYQRGTGDEIVFVTTADDRTYYYEEYEGTTLEDWVLFTWDLARYAGQEVRMFWVIQANSSGNYTGLWIDDIEVTAATGDAPSITINSPNNGDTVNGKVTFNVTVNEYTQLVKLTAIPPVLGGVSWAISDGTYDLAWDSRHPYNGGVLCTLAAYDSTAADGLVATAARALTVNNTTRDPAWYDGFESITVLGGFDGSSFDGDWYTWGGGDVKWRISSDKAHLGSKCAKMGPDGTGDYGANELEYLYSPIHDGSSATNLYLRLWHQLDVESDGDDYAKIQLVIYDGLDDIEIPLADFRADTSGTDWHALVFDLTAFKDDLLRINFEFVSDADANVGKGWFIDDFEILDADPDITDIEDPSGAPGKAVTVNGYRFGNIQGDSTVKFAKDGGGTTTASVSSWSDTAIQVTVPSDAVSGDVTVTVLGHESAGEYFGVTLAPPSLDDLEQL